MPSMRIWKAASVPNYSASIDKKYPYSEVPYLGEYNLVKLPVVDNNLLDHIDYWGEGRIDMEQGTSGFKDSYNVNHQYQLVSNGPDTNRKIPNRIPVTNYTKCDTSSYIRGNSVRIVTVMGAPINKSCAKDIARMVNEEEGIVVVYGFDETSADVKNLTEELQKKYLIFCPSFELPEKLLGLTLFDSHRVYLNKREITSKLHNYVSVGLFDNAVKLTQNCISTHNQKLVTDTVELLLKEGVKNVMMFAYKLWITDTNIVGDYFPKPFKLIFHQDQIKIVNRLQNMPLKLDKEIDVSGDRIAWGDGVDSANEFLRWKLNPVLKDNKIYFQIENIEFSMKLKLADNSDSYGDRVCWGDGNNVDASRLNFTLEPIKKDNDIIFLIFNQQYGQSLKLDASTDSLGNRKLWANDYFINEDYDRFGWHIVQAVIN